MSTIPDVFIIESLDPTDEGNGRFEGSIVSNMLRLHGKIPKYQYVRTRKEFKQALKQFGESNYRYLHISAHGHSEGMVTTNLENIDFNELGELLKHHLSNKRLFLSTCLMMQGHLAGSLIPHTNCYSVVGPVDKIDFHKAAIFWASVYHLLFVKDSERIQRSALAQILAKAAALFEVNIRYLSRDSRSKKGFRDETCT
ncbi:hypothetical protein [Rhizobium laguerreae]|uniref:hypothetical protein n=1 Tax=Rhizobium laguerreae TaxID=1076926 RepID=UPI001C8FE9EF|nr:hypothetical protein [Rhizobium laguerreae]MBY3117287.1 hypothetical protein [Rhizobium laguerreae]